MAPDGRILDSGEVIEVEPPSVWCSNGVTTSILRWPATETP